MKNSSLSAILLVMLWGVTGMSKMRAQSFTSSASPPSSSSTVQNIGLPPLQQERINSIIHSIQTGNADELASFFNSSIDLTLVDDDNVYSKVQANMVMKEFFQHYIPEKVSMRHSGNSANGSSYAILNYRSKAKDSLRVVFYLKSYDGQYLINELRFDMQK